MSQRKSKDSQVRQIQPKLYLQNKSNYFEHKQFKPTLLTQSLYTQQLQNLSQQTPLKKNFLMATNRLATLDSFLQENNNAVTVHSIETSQDEIKLKPNKTNLTPKSYVTNQTKSSSHRTSFPHVRQSYQSQDNDDQDLIQIYSLQKQDKPSQSQETTKRQKLLISTKSPKQNRVTNTPRKRLNIQQQVNEVMAFYATDEQSKKNRVKMLS